MRIALLALVIALAAGCVSSEEADGARVVTATPVASASALPEATAEATGRPQPTMAPAPADDPDDPLGLGPGRYPDSRDINRLGIEATCVYGGEELCTDSNGNAWPDVVEQALGRDPSVDACLADSCGTPDLQSFQLGSVQGNTLFVLDASGSMVGSAGGGQTKMEAAKDALVEYVTVTPEFVDLGLVVYGHRGDNTQSGREESCAGIETFAEIGELTHGTVEQVVAGFQPTGWTPVAASLEAAGPLLQAAAADDEAAGLEGVTNRVILISDGIETCGGDPVAAAQGLVDLGISVVVDVIGFDVPTDEREALMQVAELTGGVYRDAATGDALREVLAEYDAQQAAVYDAITCQVLAQNETGACSSVLAQEASAHFADLAADAVAAGEPERGTFLTDWAREARDESFRRRQAVIEELQAGLAELRELRDEALDRRAALDSDPNRKLVSRAVFHCPSTA
ncbi:hypothetical protein BH23ACT9_BH23ACT9_10650 [soil metagenome]